MAAGVALSLAALAAALYGIHRLTTLELTAGAGARPDRVAVAARLAVMLTALAPMAFFFSAVYSESLYLALSVGLFLCARRGRWTWVGVLGALAGATRSTGLVLPLPALMIYLYGPREDRARDFSKRGCAGRAAREGGVGRGRCVSLRAGGAALCAAQGCAVAVADAGGRGGVWGVFGVVGR